MAVGEGHEVVISRVHVGRVDVDEFDAVFGCVFRGYDFFSSGNAGLVDIGNDDAFRFVFVVDAVAYSTEAHGAAAAEDDDVAAFFSSHGVIVVLLIRMVVGVVAADDAAHGFAQGGFEEAFTFVRHEGA